MKNIFKGLFKGVGLKLIGSTLIVLVAVLLSTIWLSSRGVKDVLYGQIDAQGKSLCDVIAVSSVESLLIQDYPVLETCSSLLVKEEGDVEFVIIERQDGRVIASAPAGISADYSNSRFRVYSSNIHAYDSSDYYLGRVIVGMSTRKADAVVASGTQSLVYITILSFITVTFVLLVILKRVVIKPLAELDDQAKALGLGRLDTAISMRGNDEIGRLAMTLEKMRRQVSSSYAEIQEQNEELKRLDQMKDNFLANVTHELRTPMNSILGFSDLLSRESLTGEQKKFVGLICNSGRNLMEIINDILDYSKIAQGKLDIEIVDCSLEDILANITDLFSTSAGKKGLDFVISRSGNLPETLYTDPVRLKQCLVNLISNSIKFTEKGHVKVFVSTVEIEGIPSIRFDVEDTGVGIAPDKQECIFESFTQADGSHSRKYGGTGLGLTITRQLVGILGGKLSLQSQVGRGSVFSIELPCSDKFPVSGPCSTESTNTVGESCDQGGEDFEGKVLVAEDFPQNQILIRVLLEKMGLKVTIADNGQEAVNKAAGEEFDLILMDIKMPVKDGLEAARELRSNNITTPIIALTACSNNDDEEKCIQAGCNAFLPKPINRENLYEVICEYIPSLTCSAD